MKENEENEDPERFQEMLDSLPEEARDLLFKAASESMTEDEFIRLIFVGDCPACESENTISCDETEGIEDPTVGLCNDCGYLWCLECGTGLDRGENCGHWDICDQCDEEKDEFEECGIEPWECPHIAKWMEEMEAPGFESTCAWCGGEITGDSGIIAVGVKVKEGFDFVNRGGAASSSFITVMVGGRAVHAIVTAEDSDAKREGNDLMFMTCGGECAGALKTALEEERSMVEKAELN